MAANVGLKGAIKRALFTLPLAAILSVSTASVAYAAIPVPRIKPEPPAMSAFLTDADARYFRSGISAVHRGHWRDVERATERVTDQTAKDVLLWFRAARDPLPPMDVMKYVTHVLSDYPRMTGIRAKAEARLFEESLSPQKTVAWFQGLEPVSGEGRVALARAHYAMGNRQSGDLWLRSAWRDSRLTRSRQQEVFKQFKDKLSQDDHAARADHLIWLGGAHFSKAQALLPYMSRDDRALMNVRMKLARNASGIDAAIKALPTKYANDAGFLYERAKWRRKKIKKEYALPLYLEIKTPPESDKGKERIWREKKIMTYWAIEEGLYQDAYDLTRSHGMSRGVGFAEAEFLAGWLALQKLNRPKDAAEHFALLQSGVTTPVSLSRAAYWSGRAHEKLGSGQDRAHYAAAGQFTNTYYGQLAATRQSGRLSQMSLPLELISEDAKLRFKADRRVRAMHLLGEAGEERYFSQFAFHLDDVLDSQDELSLLAVLAKDYGYMRPSIRAAKQAGRFQTMLTDSGYPQIAAIDALPAKFNKPFVYAIARQESEFSTDVVSSAKAYGLMQMINATAKATARKHRIPYSKTRLNSDGDYAANLGAHHLHDLLDMWDGSYILAAVSYNAGPHRARQWIKTYGDPRTGEIDPVDWVEKIPFSETRNYVQRVMENMQVYRARLNGNQAPNQLEQDLRNGAF
ncbi:lytic transglycosylase domain-containing protein [Litorimonas sp. RW-G-Af-16]|uniref:lytic transglycosylase domain-containing protein n=1 Tax=Litorimonas sp. RW-G-Af-16 TaxID=3241168 RepID=UPI00390CB172